MTCVHKSKETRALLSKLRYSSKFEILLLCAPIPPSLFARDVHRYPLVGRYSCSTYTPRSFVFRGRLCFSIYFAPRVEGTSAFLGAKYVHVTCSRVRKRELLLYTRYIGWPAPVDDEACKVPRTVSSFTTRLSTPSCFCSGRPSTTEMRYVQGDSLQKRPHSDITKRDKKQN